MVQTQKAKVVKVDSTLSKGLSILEHLAKKQSSVGVSELSRELGLTKSNTFRLLQSLTALGYVRHGEDRTYSATLKIWQVGREIVDQLNLRELCAPELHFLSHETGETIYLAVPEGMMVVYIDKIESQKPIRSWNPIGGSAPMHCVGTGKAILASSYEKRRGGISEALTRHTEKTLVTIDALDADMAETQKRGYAYDTGEFRDRILSFGAPIVLPDGEPIAAVGISVPDVNLPENGEALFGKLVASAASNASAKLAQR